MQKGIFLQDLNTKSRTVNNAIIQLGDIDDSGKGRKFVSKFIQPGLVKIEGHGIVLLRKETLDESLPTIVGSPVIIQHKDVTEENADELRCGVIANAYFNQPDGWYYVDGIIWDDKAQDLINKGWSVSCSYDYLAFNDEGGEENNIHYDKEFTQLNFTHLAIVDNPRYERANIVFNSKDEEKGKWVTIKGNHIFIPDGKTLDEVIKEKGWGDKENKQSESENKHGFKKDKDSGYYMKDLSDGTSVYVEKKAGGQGEKEPFYLEATHFDKDGKTIAKKQYHYDSMDGMFGKIDKDFEQGKEKQSDTKDGEEKKFDLGDKLGKLSIYEMIDKGFEPIETGGGSAGGSGHGYALYDSGNKNDLSNYYRMKTISKDEFEQAKAYQEEKQNKQLDSKGEKQENNKADNSKEQDMAIIEELKKLIFKVENQKENKMDSKSKILSILNEKEVDKETIEEIKNELEKIEEKEEVKNKKKVKNEEEEIEEKEEEKEVDNEEEKDEEKVEELKKEEKKDVDNKCKNSKEESYFDKINKIYNSAKKIEEPSVEYESKQARLDAGKEYFG